MTPHQRLQYYFFLAENGEKSLQYHIGRKILKSHFTSYSILAFINVLCYGVCTEICITSRFQMVSYWGPQFWLRSMGRNLSLLVMWNNHEHLTWWPIVNNSRGTNFTFSLKNLFFITSKELIQHGSLFFKSAVGRHLELRALEILPGVVQILWGRRCKWSNKTYWWCQQQWGWCPPTQNWLWTLFCDQLNYSVTQNRVHKPYCAGSPRLLWHRKTSAITQAWSNIRIPCYQKSMVTSTGRHSNWIIKDIKSLAELILVLGNTNNWQYYAFLLFSKPVQPARKLYIQHDARCAEHCLHFCQISAPGAWCPPQRSVGPCHTLDWTLGLNMASHKCHLWGSGCSRTATCTFNLS